MKIDDDRVKIDAFQYDHKWCPCIGWTLASSNFPHKKECPGGQIWAIVVIITDDGISHQSAYFKKLTLNDG